MSDRTVHQYEGGYTAYVLARARRERPGRDPRGEATATAAQENSRGCGADRRRGTTKPKFGIEAANNLVSDEPPVRDTTELLRFLNRTARHQGAGG